MGVASILATISAVSTVKAKSSEKMYKTRLDFVHNKLETVVDSTLSIMAAYQ